MADSIFSWQDRGQIRNLIDFCLYLSSLVPSDDDVREKQRPEAVASQSSVICNRNLFDIQLILGRVMSHLPVNSLLEHRLVNEYWNIKALPPLQQKKKVVIVKPKEFSRFHACFVNAEVLPFLKLGITLEGMSEDDCTEFFALHGVKILDLDIIESESTQMLNFIPDEEWIRQKLEILKCIFRHVQNLKKLSLHLNHLPKSALFNGVFDGQEVALEQVKCLGLESPAAALGQGFLDGLFKMLPSVQVLELGYFAPEQNWEVFVTAIKDLNIHSFHRTCQNRGSDARHLTNLAEPAALWNALAAESSLRLRELSIWLNTDSFPNLHLLDVVQPQENFLRSQSECLEVLNLTYTTLNLEDIQNVGLPFLRLPFMKNLKSLKLDLTNFDSPIHPMHPIEPRQVPNLRKVSIEQHSILDQIFLTDGTFPSVTKLHLDWKYMYTQMRLRKFGAWFPNLKKLTGFVETNASADEMELIVRNFPNIEELEWNFTDFISLGRRGFHYRPMMQNLNLVLSGVPLDSKWALTQMADRVGYETLGSWMDPPGFSLRDLRRLKKLLIRVCSPEAVAPPIARIDEIGVYLTFLKLSPQMQLTFHGQFSISDDLAAKLTAHFQNVVFSPSMLCPQVIRT